MIVHINYLLKQVNPSHFWCILTRHCFTCLLLYFDHQSKYVDKIDMRKLYSLTVKFMKLNTNNDNLKRYKRSSAIWCIYIYIYITMAYCILFFFLNCCITMLYLIISVFCIRMRVPYGAKSRTIS